MTNNPDQQFRNDTTPAEKLESLFQDQALRNAQRRKDASTFQQFGQSQASEEGGRFAKPTQVVDTNAVPEYPKQPPGSFSNQAAVLPPEESLGFSVDDVPIVGEEFEVAASIERLERTAQEASLSHDAAEPVRGAAGSEAETSSDVEPPPTQHQTEGEANNEANACRNQNENRSPAA